MISKVNVISIVNNEEDSTIINRWIFMLDRTSKYFNEMQFPAEMRFPRTTRSHRFLSNEMFPNTWNGRYCPIEPPARSLDFTPSTFSPGDWRGIKFLDFRDKLEAFCTKKYDSNENCQSKRSPIRFDNVRSSLHISFSFYTAIWVEGQVTIVSPSDVQLKQLLFILSAIQIRMTYLFCCEI